MQSYYSANGLLNRGLYDLAADEYRAFLVAYPEHEKIDVVRYGLGVSLFRLGEYASAAETLAQLQDQADFEFAAEALFTLGQAQLEQQDHEAAADSFSELRRRHPKHDLFDDAAALQAQALYHNGDFAEVAEPCKAIQKKMPDSPLRQRAELFWGLAKMAENEHGDAAVLFEQMIVRYPDGDLSDHTTLLLAQSLHHSAALEDAITRYRSVVLGENDEYVPDALYGLALVQHQRGDAGPAREALDRLLTEYSDHELSLQARHLRGRARFDLGDFDGAAEDFGGITESESDLADDATYWRAKCDLRKGAAAEAAQRLSEAMERFPESTLQPEMHYDRAVALLRIDQPDEAMQHLSKMRDESPKHRLSAPALHLMAVTEHEQERYDRSGALCQTYIDEYAQGEKAADIAFLAAENLFLTREYEKALARYGEFLERYPEDQQIRPARFRKGLCAFHLGDCEAAIVGLGEVVNGRETEVLFQPALLAIGDCYFQNEQWSDAVQPLDDYLSFGGEQAAIDDAMLKLGLAHQRMGNHDQALAAFQLLTDTVGSESEHYVQALFERGQVLVVLGRDEDAAELLALVIEAEEEGGRFTPHAHNHLGAVAMRSGDHAAAAKHYLQVVSTASDASLLAEARLQMGQALLSYGELTAAAQAFGEVTTEHPSAAQAPQAAALQAIALSRAGQHEEALSRITKVQQEHLESLDNDLSTTLRYEKAWCHRAADQPDAAASAYRELLAESSDHALRRHAALELAELDFEAGRLQEAADQLERLGRIEDLDPQLAAQAKYRLGVCRYQQGLYEPSAQLLSAFVDQAPQDDERVPSARLLCGEALFKLGRHDMVVEQMTKIVESYPDDEACGPALLRLGESQAALQRWPQSREAFAGFLQERGDSPLWYQAKFGIGWSLENQGDFDDAIAVYREVVQRHQGPTAARAQFQIGECLFAQKRYEEAARELLKVDILYAYPEWSAAAVYETGRCFEELSNPVAARQQFEQVIAQHPDTEWAVLAAQRLESLSEAALPGR
jgi:TolA-binding protein